MKTVWIIGGGWAGISAAVQGTELGLKVVLFEAKKDLGGRARTVKLPAMQIDNGQHILLGAYQETLALMRKVGLDPQALLHRQRLDLRGVDGGGFKLLGYSWLPSSVQFILGTLFCRGWSAADKFSLISKSLNWATSKFNCAPNLSVKDLSEGLTKHVQESLITPLCLAVFNTPPKDSSGQVFLRVLNDALFSGKGSSDLLIPKSDMGDLLPEAAHRWLISKGCEIRLAERINECPIPNTVNGSTQINNSVDAVILACDATSACSLIDPINSIWANQCRTLEHTHISTTYIQCDDTDFTQLARPILMLQSDTGSSSQITRPAQFVFDRGFLFKNNADEFKASKNKGVLSFVSSFSTLSNELISEAVLNQAKNELKLRDIKVIGTISEKRATFCCSPGLIRPGQQITQSIWACGDYLEGPYPSTLEGAVISGKEVIKKMLIQSGQLSQLP